jgi:hypothetical protein
MRLICTFPLPTDAWEVFAVLQSLGQTDPLARYGPTLPARQRYIFEKDDGGGLRLYEAEPTS